MIAKPLVKGFTLMCNGLMKMWEGVRTEERKRAEKLLKVWSQNTENSRKTSQGHSDSWPQQRRTTLVLNSKLGHE